MAETITPNTTMEPRHNLKRTLAVTAGGLGLALLGGVVGGVVASRGEEGPTPPRGDRGVAAGPIPSPTAESTPTPRSGGFDNMWKGVCHDYEITDLEGGQIELTPKVRRMEGAAPERFFYTLTTWTTPTAPDVTTAVRGIESVRMYAADAVGDIALAVVYFPDSKHQPTGPSDIRVPIMDEFPEAVILACPPVFAEDYGFARQY